MIINIHAEFHNNGWLFEDYKELLLKSSPRRCVVITTKENPIVDANAWIFFRPEEIAKHEKIIDFGRTIFVLHDFYEEDGRFDIAARCKGFCLLHPHQIDLLCRVPSFSPLDSQMLIRPTGALSFFFDNLRKGMPNVPTVGFFGRPAFRKGTDIKRVRIFTEACKIVAASFPNLRVLFVGENLEEYAKALKQHRIQADFIAKKQVGIEGYPNLYDRTDLICVPSLLESQPCVFFEAQARGIPVVGCNTGWMSLELKNGFNGINLGDPSQLQCMSCAAGIMEILSKRKDWSKKQELISGLFKEYTMEHWAKLLIGFAIKIAREADRSPTTIWNSSSSNPSGV